MSKVKQILAGVVSAAMVVTMMPAVTFANDIDLVQYQWTKVEPAPTASAYSGQVKFDATVTIKHGSNIYTPIQVEDADSFVGAVNQAVAGDVVDVDGDIVLTANLPLWTGKTLANNETISLDLTDALLYEIVAPGTAANGFKLTTPFKSVALNNGVYTYANMFYDVSNMTIDFPTEYTSGGVNGVTLSFTMANGEVYTAKTVAYGGVGGAYYAYPDGTQTQGGDDFLRVGDSNAAFAIYVEELGTGATCTKAGSEVLHAYVTKGPKAVEEGIITNLLDESTKDYGTLDPLGHAYVTPASRIVDGIFELPNYSVGDKKSKEAYGALGYGVYISWAIRGKDANVIKSVDADGNTAIDSVKTKCLNGDNHGVGADEPTWTDAVSYEIIDAAAGTPATSTAAGSTVYTVRIETADGATAVVKQRVYDIPGLEASTIGRFTGMTFETGVYKYIESTKTYELQDTTWLNTLYAEYTPVEGGWLKTIVADNGAINYQITYADAISNTGNAKLTGVLTPAASIAANAYGNTTKLTTSTPQCGMNKFYYEPLKINVVKTACIKEGEEYVDSTEYVYVGATDATMTVVALEDSVTDTVEGMRTINRVGDSATATAVYPFAIVVPKNGYTCTTSHTFDMNDGTYDITTPATTYSDGAATITCKYCGGAGIEVVLPRLTTNVLYVNKAETGATAADDTSNAHVYTVEPTCTTPGYSYYRAIKSWADYKPNDKTTYAEVVIDGTQKDALGHDWYIASQSDVKWTGTTICEIEYRCKHAKAGEEHQTKKVTYYAANGTSTETKIYKAISSSIMKAEDCTALDRIVYTVDGVVDVLGNKIQTSVEATTCGDHKFVDSINWSTDGKTATVTRTCQNEGCLGAGNSTTGGYHKTPLVVSATVTSENQADGSILYTASYEGEVLGTKKVFDLNKAKVVVNGGEAVDTNIYKGTSLDNVAPFVVKINDVEISSDLYTIVKQTEVSYYFEGDGVIIPIQALGIEVTAAKDTDAIGSAIGAFNSLGYNTFKAAKYKLDGKAYTQITNDSFEYDGLDHPFTVSEITAGDNTEVALKNVTIEYATSTATKMATLTDKQKLEVAPTLIYSDELNLSEVAGIDKDGDALPYYVFVKLSADKFTTGYLYAGTVTVEPFELTGVAITITNPTIVYGEQIVATTGDEFIDELIDLEVADTTKLGVGSYGITGTNLITTNGNYKVGANWTNASMFVVNPRKATIVQTETSKTYDGVAVDKDSLFTIEGIVNDDVIDLLVTTAGNEEILNAGTYTLAAAANNANYTIEKLTAFYIVDPASIKGATVTPKKASMTWTGKALKPGVASVVLADGTELATTDYSVVYTNNTNVGTAKITVKGKGNYTGTATATFKITKATQKVKSVSPTKKTVKAGASFKITAKATKEQGTAQFKKTSGNAGITISSAGKVTVKKTVKAGKYTIKYKVRIKATKNCKATAYKTKKVVVTVK